MQIRLRNSARLINTLQTNLCTGRPPLLTAHFRHVARAYLRIPLRADNACVFLNNALGSPGRHQKRSRFTLIADENSCCLPLDMVAVEFRPFEHRAVNGLASRILNFDQTKTCSGLPRGGREADHRAKARKQFEGASIMTAAGRVSVSNAGTIGCAIVQCAIHASLSPRPAPGSSDCAHASARGLRRSILDPRRCRAARP